MSGPGDARARPLPGELARLLHDVRGPLNSAVMHLEVVKRVVAGTGRGAESLDIALDQLTWLAALLPSAFEVVAHDLGAREAVDLHAVAVQAVAQHPGATVHVAGSLSSNYWNGSRGIQFRISDIALADPTGL